MQTVTRRIFFFILFFSVSTFVAVVNEIVSRIYTLAAWLTFVQHISIQLNNIFFFVLCLTETKSLTSSMANQSLQTTTDNNDEVNTIIQCRADGETKSREVSPKLVVGGKKYGRRSRPQSAIAFNSSPSESDDDDEQHQSAHDRNANNNTASDKVRSKRVSKS